MVRSSLFFSFFLNCINLIFMHFKKSSLISVLFIRKNCDWVVIYVGHWYASTWKYSGIQVSRTVLDAVITFVTYQECSHSPEFQLSCLCFRSVCMFSYAFACLCVDTQLKFLPFASVCVRARACVHMDVTFQLKLDPFSYTSSEFFLIWHCMGGWWCTHYHPK